MRKKRGKSKASSKKHIIKSEVTSKELQKPPEAQKPIKEALHELEILSEEKNVKTKVEDIEKKEEEIEKKETEIITEEKKIELEEKKVEKLEEEIKNEVMTKPLKKISLKDINKGIIGAFIGVVAHFGFIYGKTIAKYISVPRASLLFMFSYLVILILMYETGYREIKEKRLLGILPRRATIIYFTSLFVVVIIFFLFNLIDLSDISGLYKEIAVTSVLASVGAGTADLIGKD
ncbi:MAG: hypothetical protein AABX33_00500 [Nanoarchaeota archaeon]